MTTATQTDTLNPATATHMAMVAHAHAQATRWFRAGTIGYHSILDDHLSGYLEDVVHERDQLRARVSQLETAQQIERTRIAKGW